MADRFFSIVDRITDIFILNIIWMICCLPVITAGASTTALLYMCMRIIRKEETYTVRGFLKAFGQNFVQSTIIWLILLIAGGFVYFIRLKLALLQGPAYIAAGALMICLFILLFMCLVYVFALTARYENSIYKTMINAVTIAVTRISDTIWLMGLFLIPIVIIFLVPCAAIALILFGGSGLGLLAGGRYVRIFEQVGQETLEDNGE